MAEIAVDDITMAALLEKLRKGEWQIPKFQREFVWTTASVEALIESVFFARPIGMVTLWEQADNSGLELENISLPETGHNEVVYFTNGEKPPTRRYAVLDGRQRSTAIAMAFGGLRPFDERRKYAGQFFLSLRREDEYERVQFKRTAEIDKLNLQSDAGCLSQGLVPLALPDGEELTSRWINFVQMIKDPSIYPGGTLPEAEELEERNQILNWAFKGLNKTKLAVYVVPPEYSLGDICEIFETLNTTGTKVSTVDLIHSWLYADTESDKKTLLLRDWLEETGNLVGAVGWVSRERRPELAAQIVTACYVALEKRHEPRAVGGKTSSVNSVKAGDLLSTPMEHWRDVMRPENTELLASFLQDFQSLVAGGLFPAARSPYPASAAIYVALRWHRHFDDQEAMPWSIDQLNALYRGFFWRNVLSTRYDQGFLTQVGADIRNLKSLLLEGSKLDSPVAWVKAMDQGLEDIIDKVQPSLDHLVGRATDGSTAGAMRDALRLRMLARAQRDIIDPRLPLDFGVNSDVELHHIFPRKWLRTNRVGEIDRLLSEKSFGHDWLGSTANLMPLSKKSNNSWRDNKPAQVLNDEGIKYEDHPEYFEQVFIDKDGFKLLTKPSAEDHGEVREFWEQRARLIVDDLLDLTKVKL